MSNGKDAPMYFLEDIYTASWMTNIMQIVKLIGKIELNKFPQQLLTFSFLIKPIQIRNKKNLFGFNLLYPDSELVHKSSFGVIAVLTGNPRSHRFHLNVQTVPLKWKCIKHDIKQTLNF